MTFIIGITDFYAPNNKTIIIIIVLKKKNVRACVRYRPTHDARVIVTGLGGYKRRPAREFRIERIK